MRIDKTRHQRTLGPEENFLVRYSAVSRIGDSGNGVTINDDVESFGEFTAGQQNVEGANCPLARRLPIEQALVYEVIDFNTFSLRTRHRRLGGSPIRLN